MNIQVRVLSAQAMREFAKLSVAQQALIAGNAKSAAAAGGFGPASTGGLMAMEKWGNKAQWAGRQLSYNFTMPLLLAGAAGGKFALDNEKAMVRVQKVYGDATHGSQFYKKEIDSLGNAFEMLSNKFGVNRAEVINVAADWAAAGASGVALAKSTQLTLQTMILGEMNQVDATAALISIQAQYGQSTDQLSQTIDTLNMVENQTGITMEGLIQGFARSAGVARTAGIDVQHLAALLAALTPAAGSATRAGNSVKTIISRLMSPTKETAQVLGLMGTSVKELGWNSMNGTQRLDSLGKAFTNLKKPQQLVVATTLASRFQLNAFSVLIRDMQNPMGYYLKALDSTANATANYNQKVSELNQVLTSNPQKLKIIWTTLQNAMADVVQPMLPFIVGLAASFVLWLKGFQNLDPHVQKFVIVAAIMLALLGPILKYLGSIFTIIGYLGNGFLKLGQMLGIFTVSTLAADGSVSKARGGLALLFKQLFTLLFFPFKMLALGLLAIGDGALLMAKRLVFALGTTGLFTFFKGQLTMMLVFAKDAFIALSTIALRGMIAFATRLAMSGPILAAVGGLSRAVGVLWGLMELGLLAITTAFNAAMIGLWGFLHMGLLNGVKAFAFAIGVAWGWMESALLAIQRAFNTAMVALWGFMQLGLLNGVKIFSFAVGAVWGFMESAIVAANKAFWFLVGVVWGTMEAVLTAGLKVFSFTVGVVWGFMHETVLFLARRFWIMLGAVYGFGEAALIFIVRSIGPALIAALSSPWTYAIAAVVLLLFAFRDKIGAIWNGLTGWARGAAGNFADAFAPLGNFFGSLVNGIEKAFWRLPAGIRDAFLSVVRIVTSAAKAVYNMFSYLNPFATHSPSLVDNVKKGMAVVGTHYATVSKPEVFKKATGDITAHKNALASIGAGPFADEKANVTKGIPAMLPLFNSLMLDLTRLNGILTTEKAAVDAQQATVNAWKSSLDAANIALDVQSKKLDGLQANLDKLTTAYDTHKTAMDSYASAPLAGMLAMNNAIFDNTMAQKQLQLEMLKMGDAGNIDALRNKFQLLQGEIETLRGTREDLRKAGAGSDVLAAYDNQLKALGDQQTAVQASTGPIADMAAQLAALQHQADIMDLEKSLQFDPLTHQIENMVNLTKELTFQQVTDGIARERAAMDTLQPSIDAATAAVAAQKPIVDALTASRDAISAQYDIENAKLTALNDEYSKTAALVSDVESAIRAMGASGADAIAKVEAAKAAAKAAQDTLTPGGQNFVNAAGADYPEVGGQAKIGREGTIADQAKVIDDWVKKNSGDVAGAFGKLDMMQPFKDMWNTGWKWLEKNIFPTVSAFGNAFKDAWDGAVSGIFHIGPTQAEIALGITGSTKTIGDKLKEGLGKVTGAVSDWWNNNVKPIINLLAPDFVNAWNAIYGAGERIYKQLLPALVSLFKELWPIIKVVAQVVGGVLLFAIKVIAAIFANVLAPALNAVIDIFTDIIRVVKGVAEIIVGVFSNDWSKIGQGLLDVFGGLINGIVDIFKGLGGLIWGVLSGFVTGVIGFFKYLWDQLVGHSIIPDMINAIVQWFKNLGPWVIAHIVSFITGAVAWFATLPGRAWNAIISLKDKVGQIATDAFNRFIANARAVWDGAKGIMVWLGGLGAAAWGKAQDIVTKIGNVAKNAFNAFLANAKALWDGKGGIMTWIGGLAGAVAAKMAGIGTSVANAVKGAWNGAADWINKNGIANINKVTSKLGFTIGNLPRFDKGGVVPGGQSRTDNVLAAVRSGEGIIVPEAVKALGGKAGLDRLNRAAESGRMYSEPDSKNGLGMGDGIGDWLRKGAGYALSMLMKPLAGLLRKAIPGDSFVENFMAGTLDKWAEAAKTWGDNKDAQDAATGGSGDLGGIGFVRMMQVLGAQFPGITMNSGFRAGAITSSGNQSYHSMGRAVDIPPSRVFFDWIRQNYGLTSKELIYTPEGARQIKDGRSYVYTGQVALDHYNHVHWAYDDGGWLKPGTTQVRNTSGKPEPVFSVEQWATVKALVAASTNVLKSVTTGTVDGTTGLRGAALVNANARLRGFSTTQTTQSTSGKNVTELHFHGDLTFPNVKSGSDAKDFIQNLESLAV